MAENPERLTCISILICDEIYRDESSKKLVIIGTFNRLFAPKFPCRHPQMTVLFSVTNGKGTYDLHLIIEHEKSGAQIAQLGGPFAIDDPLAISDINLKLHNLEFSSEGKYWVTIKADGEILQQRPFFVQATSRPEAES